MKPLLTFVFCAVLLLSKGQQQPLFKTVSPDDSRVSFINQITESDTLNYFFEDDLYNGAGLAVGDINNDGLADIYFVSNFGEDQLYLNQGNLKFKNITAKAFDGDFTDGWKTAASMADVNGDGFLDIYVCKRGQRYHKGYQRQNLLFINNGDLTFTEKGKEYRVNDFGRSVDADFLDYDQDGDLDLWVTNRRKNTSVMEQFNKQTLLEPHHSNRLFRNDGDQFKDVTTKESGLRSFGFCLSSSVGDLNGDGWPDIYVAGDYNLPDFMFINDGHGNYRNQIRMRLKHTSHYSMGTDIADYNNDGWQDVFVLDMANTSYVRSKVNMGSMSISTFWENVARGYHYQYMYNTLQLNLGHGYFSEIAQMSGIASTDWSWAPLLADFDGDGFKDLFVTNGYLRDVRNQDFTARLKAYMATDPETFDHKKMLADIPVSEEVNFFFRNKGDLTFEDVSANWGMTEPTISQGAAYADLDNDGDLDLVMNNMNSVATILENQSKSNYIQLKLNGPAKNTSAIGSKVEIKTGEMAQTQEIYPSRGYASSSEHILTFGLGNSKSIDELIIHWNPLEITVLNNVEINQRLEINYVDAKKVKKTDNYSPFAYFKPESHRFTKVPQEDYDDFKRELLIPHKMSELGPFMATADVNGDSKEDLFIGGNKDFPSRLYLNLDGEMELKNNEAFLLDSAYEDGEAIFLDIDGDGDLDLYVSSGGNEYEKGSEYYQDRLYTNDGKGNFSRNLIAVPIIRTSTQCVQKCDVDKDGDIDLFVGGRQVPGEYPNKPGSFLLINENGQLIDKTKELSPDLKELGMVTDALFSDLNDDGKNDLIVVGEWMKPTVFINDNGKFKLTNEHFPSKGLNGWWNAIQAFDLEGDGQFEYLLGNIGLNNKFHPDKEQGMKIYLDDFDKNGKYDIVLSKYFSGEEHPVRGRECLSQQMPMISEKYKTYMDFATAEFNEILELPEDYQYVDNFASGMLKKVNDKWTFIPLPKMAQIGPINEFVTGDVNGDGRTDLVTIGNRYEAEIETPRYDANPGLILINDPAQESGFKIMTLQQVGFNLNQNAKDAVRIESDIFISNSAEDVKRYSVFLE